MVHRCLPLAKQVASEILTGLEAGDLALENGLLPSEAELGQRFNVSRATLREALSRLEQRGVIERRQGVGTFVIMPPLLIAAGLEQLESLNAMAQRMGLETHMGQAVIEERPTEEGEAS